ncbi:MAG: hypothetical protein IPL64_08465 [Flavobacteriales bacterium]|nr:hypothetical protein [Flavobacteriales bacterium]
MNWSCTAGRACADGERVLLYLHTIRLGGRYVQHAGLVALDKGAPVARVTRGLGQFGGSGAGDGRILSA